MGKFFRIWLFVIIFSFPNIIVAQSSEEKWISLQDYLRKGYNKTSDGFTVENGNFSSPEKLTYFSKLAFTPYLNKTKNGSKFEIKISKIKNITNDGNISWFPSQIIFNQQYKIKTGGNSISLKSLPKIQDGNSVFDMDGYGIITSIVGIIENEILNNIYVLIGGENDPKEIILFHKEEKNRIQQEQNEEQKKIEMTKLEKQKNFEKNLYRKPLDLGVNLLRIENLEDGSLKGIYEGGYSVIIYPNGDYSGLGGFKATLSDGTIIDNETDDKNDTRIFFTNGDKYVGTLKGSPQEFINYYDRFGRKGIDECLNSKDQNRELHKGSLYNGKYIFSNGNEVRIGDGANLTAIYKEEQEAKEAKEKADKEHLNALYNKYGKVMVDKARSGEISVGMPYSLIDEYWILSTYHQSASYTWYKANNLFSILYIKVNNSTKKLTEVSKTAPTITK